MSRLEMPDDGTTANQYAVVLPCEPDYFRDFIAGLLGKPQTITKNIWGSFDFNKDDIANFYHLVVQRVAQQNESTLIQFTITIVYDDESTVLLNSFHDFMVYNEVRPVASVDAHLSWTFLVRFQDKKVPERQQIDVSMFTEPISDGVVRVSGAHPIIKRLRGNFSLHINHTARTWGADIEALLTGHIENLIKPVHRIKRSIHDNAVWIGLAVGIISFLASIAACFYSTSLHVQSRMRTVGTFPTPVAKDDYIADLIASGVWPRFFFSIFIFLCLAFVVSIILGVWTGVKAENPEPSFLVLSKQSENLKQKKLASYRRNWRIFVLSLIGSIIIELAGNTLFTIYLEKWVTP